MFSTTNRSNIFFLHFHSASAISNVTAAMSISNACYLRSHQFEGNFCPDVLSNDAFLVSSLLRQFLDQLLNEHARLVPETTERKQHDPTRVQI